MNNDRITILTPENVEFSFELAGIGSRFIALLVDFLIRALVLAAIGTAGLMGKLTLPDRWVEKFEKLFKDIDPLWAGILIIIAFIIYWGYFVFFEFSWNGQTPGKRLAGIRVMKEGGYPIGFTDALIRNLLRLVDFLPYFYCAGILSILISKKNKRVGDYAAGTIVVKERKYTLPIDLDVKAQQGILTDTQQSEAICNLVNLTRDDYLVIRNFLLRREEFRDQVRYDLGKKIAVSMIGKLNIGVLSQASLNYEAFLEHIAYLYKENEKYL